MKTNTMQLLMIAGLCTMAGAEEWRLDSDEDWRHAARNQEGLDLRDGFAKLNGNEGFYHSKVQRFETKRKVASLTLKQSDAWLNWKPVGKIQPANLVDAPVFLVRGDKDYWLFGRYGSPRNKQPFEGKPATLEGFDVPLLTTPYPNQFDAPGGLKPTKGGYHAWQSRDMKSWVHHGPVTEGFSKWVTTAEMVDGKAYIYYDFPNDQDPHLYIDEDLTDGKPGKNMGMAFNDPSHGSDCAVIRDLDGRFHVIYEDWTPINARQHSWDSPLAGHAAGRKGYMDFKIMEPAVDMRTKATGKTATYTHPHWAKEDPERYRTNVAEYEVHEPEQDAFGDWAAISIGGQCYLFCDYHPAKQKIRIAWFTSSSMDAPFTFCSEIGSGHPDPDIGFAEGRFYLLNQTSNDYVSDGPWIDGVEARVGVDLEGDGTIDRWSDWNRMHESYERIEGFSKQIKRIPASLDASALPAGKGFAFELKLQDVQGNAAKPELDRVTMTFKD